MNKLGNIQKEISNGDYFVRKNEVHKFHSNLGYGIKTYTNYNKEDNSSLVLNWGNFRGRVNIKEELTIEEWNSTVEELKKLTDEEGVIYFSSEYLDKLLK